MKKLILTFLIPLVFITACNQKEEKVSKQEHSKEAIHKEKSKTSDKNNKNTSFKINSQEKFHTTKEKFTSQQTDKTTETIQPNKSSSNPKQDNQEPIQNSQQSISNVETSTKNQHSTSQNANKNTQMYMSHDESQMGYGKGDYQSALERSKEIWKNPNSGVGGPYWVDKNEDYESWKQRQIQWQKMVTESEKRAAEDNQ
ncbi:hypothetical protein [Staphylococcus sp. EZ-P03]|uniref:hypothetical protein n=1 Tax=Staphylococcus sp. EZ-P03 TaxID=2282739 RepID=UPI000DF7226F|nr:hypothetical protein [Staphylococcus sp. EZ-P03]